jgi:putative NADH-flavin reductase
MQIAVVGATGRTGKLVIEQALGRGHSVVAIARRPVSVELAHPQLRVVAGDVLDRESLTGLFAGCDAVISTLGAGTSRAATTVYSAGVANVLAEMSIARTLKLAVISAYPAGPREERPGLMDKIVSAILWRFFGASYTDMRRMEQILGDSDVIWMALRPPRLLDKPPTGSYRIGLKPPRGGRSLRYGDLATALLDVLERREFFRAPVYVTN